MKTTEIRGELPGLIEALLSWHFLINEHNWPRWNPVVDRTENNKFCGTLTSREFSWRNWDHTSLVEATCGYEEMPTKYLITEIKIVDVPVRDSARYTFMPIFYKSCRNPLQHRNAVDGCQRLVTVPNPLRLRAVSCGGVQRTVLKMMTTDLATVILDAQSFSFGSLLNLVPHLVRRMTVTRQDEATS